MSPIGRSCFAVDPFVFVHNKNACGQKQPGRATTLTGAAPEKRLQKRRRRLGALAAFVAVSPRARFHHLMATLCATERSLCTAGVDG